MKITPLTTKEIRQFTEKQVKIRINVNMLVQQICRLREETSEEKKFNTEELNKLQEIQKKYANIQLKLGQLGFTKIRLENEIQAVNESESQLKSDFNETQKNEQLFMDEVTKKYGEGVLDPKTGTFSKNK